ncbi:MAG TPA: carbon storage regulator CsrA [Pirellulales bacterium]
MLVLSRQIGERLVIDDQIEVTVVEIRPDRVKLGITAPPEISVHREEVFRRITAAVTAHGMGHRPEESPFMSEFA